MTCPACFTEPGACLELVTRLTAWSTVACGAEFLAAHRAFANDGIAGWPLLERRSRLRGYGGWVARGLGVMFRSPGILVLFGVWLGLGLVLVGAPRQWPGWGLGVGVLFVIQLLINVRQFPIVAMGGDRLRMVVLGALTLRELVPESEWVARMTVFFIGANCVLAYFVAGVGRLRVKPWREGTGLTLVLRHRLMGDAGLAAWLTRHTAVGRLLTWGVEVFEIGFPLALLGGPVTMVPVLGAALLMHLAIGHFMGLARFVWAFLAAYPAVVFTSIKVRDWLSR